MSITQTIGITWSQAGLSPLTATLTPSADGEVNASVTMAASGITNFLVAVPIDVSNLVSLFMMTTRDCTVKTNSSSAPDQTFSLTGGVPLVWTDDMPNACPITVDVTQIYLTQAAGDADTFQLRTLQEV